jgi:hypothetical protein
MLSITPSLFNAYNAYCDGRSPIDEFLRVLAKAPSTPSPIMQDGINFENAVYELMKTGESSKDPRVSEAADHCKGGYIQVRCEKPIFNDTLVYGIADVVLPREDKIIDIKRSSSYALGKYENSIQHLVYMYALELNNFEYLIADGSSVYTEYYHWGLIAENNLKSRVYQCLDFIMSVPQFKDVYNAHWLKY